MSPSVRSNLPSIMKKLLSSTFVLMFMTTVVFGQSSEELTFTHYKAFNGVEFDYTVLLPESYEADNDYQALFVFAQGDMDQDALRWSAENIFGSDEAADWLIILPTIPDRGWHTHPSHHALEAFLDQIKKDYNVEGDIFHLTGYGEGAGAAVTYSGMSRTYWKSSTIAGPSSWNGWPERSLKSSGRENKHISFRLLVGELDEEGRAAAEKVMRHFEEGGTAISVRVFDDLGEDLESVLGSTLMAEIAMNAGH